MPLTLSKCNGSGTTGVPTISAILRGLPTCPTRLSFERRSPFSDAPAARAHKVAEEPSELGADAALRLRVEKAKHFADGDIDLTKQLIADIHSEQRQLEAQHFESRKEYARDVTESVNRRERFLFEYGIQTLKWLFLLNAGTAGALLA